MKGILNIFRGGSMKRLIGILLVLVILGAAGSVFGEDLPVQPDQEAAVSSKIDTGDTAWILISTALVM